MGRLTVEAIAALGDDDALDALDRDHALVH